MTFCVSKNCNNKCGRQLTDEIRKEAQIWWGDTGDAPIDVSLFCENKKEKQEKCTEDY